MPTNIPNNKQLCSQYTNALFFNHGDFEYQQREDITRNSYERESP